MADLPTTDAATLCDIIANNEHWLIDRILLYARRQGFNRFAFYPSRSLAAIHSRALRAYTERPGKRDPRYGVQTR